MYTCHLWLELGERPDEADCGHLNEKAAVLQALLDSVLDCVPKKCIANVNYTTVMQCSVSGNRRASRHDSLLKVLEHVCEHLPGSHGLVYWCDDENPGASVFEGYRVIVIARGQMSERYDPFLTPRRPNIED
jgi:hypothetical protein